LAKNQRTAPAIIKIVISAIDKDAGETRSNSKPEINDRVKISKPAGAGTAG
jgi:hypothetical protein